MKISHKYRLQPLLDQKSRLRKRAEMFLAKAIMRLKKEKERLETFKKERLEIIAKRKEVRANLHARVCSGKALIKDGSFGIHFIKKLEEDQKAKEKDIKNQKRVIVDCETEVQRARRDYINAAKEVRIMEKHKELWAKKVRHEMERREEVEMDELGNIIHQLKRQRVREARLGD
jgi:flagellar export protein FliJ